MPINKIICVKNKRNENEFTKLKINEEYRSKSTVNKKGLVSK